MITVDDILKPDFEWDELEIDEDEFDELSADLIIDYLKKNTPEERHLLAMSWNFDNPKKVIKWIVDQPDTDKGTILMLYWLMSPDFSKQYASRGECESGNSWYLEDYDIIQTIERNYLAGVYKSQRYAFDPRHDVYQNGYDWTSGLKPESFKVPIPQEMFIPLEGVALDAPSWEEGIPEDLQPAMDRLCDLVDE